MLVLGLGFPVAAQIHQADTDSVSTLSTVVVSGEQPGPGLWRISKDGHVMWVLFTVSPLPKGMTWKTDEVAGIIAQSGEVVMSPSANLSVKGGTVRALFLLPSLLGARNNPDKKKLSDVLPPDLYARWSALKKIHIGRDNGIEKRRPIFAAQELYAKASERAGLDSSQSIAATIGKLARKAGVNIVPTNITVLIDEPKATLREFSRSSLDDIECFRKTLDHLESDLATMKARGNAWATGDIESIRNMSFTNQQQACQDALLHASVVEKRGLDDLPQRLGSAWLAAATQAMDRHAVSFSLLSLTHAFRTDGVIATLKERGYTIQAPWEQDQE